MDLFNAMKLLFWLYKTCRGHQESQASKSSQISVNVVEKMDSAEDSQL